MLITPVIGEIEAKGKTRTELANSIAMAGKKVVLEDLDLRRHALSTMQGFGNSKKGITGYLTGAVSLDEGKISKHTNLKSEA